MVIKNNKQGEVDTTGFLKQQVYLLLNAEKWKTQDK